MKSTALGLNYTTHVSEKRAGNKCLVPSGRCRIRSGNPKYLGRGAAILMMGEGMALLPCSGGKVLKYCLHGML